MLSAELLRCRSTAVARHCIHIARANGCVPTDGEELTQKKGLSKGGGF
jgi:hypothetical protein